MPGKAAGRAAGSQAPCAGAVRAEARRLPDGLRRVGRTPPCAPCARSRTHARRSVRPCSISSGASGATMAAARLWTLPSAFYSQGNGSASGGMSSGESRGKNGRRIDPPRPLRASPSWERHRTPLRALPQPSSIRSCSLPCLLPSRHRRLAHTSRRSLRTRHTGKRIRRHRSAHRHHMSGPTTLPHRHRRRRRRHRHHHRHRHRRHHHRHHVRHYVRTPRRLLRCTQPPCGLPPTLWSRRRPSSRLCRLLRPPCIRSTSTAIMRSSTRRLPPRQASGTDDVISPPRGGGGGVCVPHDTVLKPACTEAMRSCFTAHGSRM
jgi:hypothetical protein